MTTLAYYTIVAAAIVICLASLFFGSRVFVKKCKNQGLIGSRLRFASQIVATSQMIALGLLCIFILYGFLTPVEISGLDGVALLAYCFLFLIADAIAIVILLAVSLVSYPLIVRRALALGASIPEKVSVKSDIHNFFIAIILFISFCIVLLYAWPGMRKELWSQMVSVTVKATGSVWLVKFEKNEYTRLKLYRYLAEKKQDSSICNRIESTTDQNNCHRVLGR